MSTDEAVPVSTVEDVEELQRRRELVKRRELVARLQPTVPRTEWRTHPRFFGSIASHFLGFHEHFRQDLRDVIETVSSPKRPLAQRVREAKARFDGFSEHLHVHHTIEEHKVFPQIKRQFPHLRPSVAMLDRDHGQLEGMFKDIGDAFAAKDVSDIVRTLHVLQDHLLRHLEDEEDLLVPLMLQGHLGL